MQTHSIGFVGANSMQLYIMRRFDEQHTGLDLRGHPAQAMMSPHHRLIGLRDGDRGNRRAIMMEANTTT